MLAWWPIMSESPNKKAKTFGLPFTPTFTPQDTSTIGAPKPPVFKTGKQFSDAIDALRTGGEEMVSTKFDLKVKPSNEKARTVTVKGDISVMQHNTGLTQGWLNTPSNTSYLGEKYNSSVFPQNLSLQRAKLEARAIKQLAPLGDGYKADAKVSPLDEMPMLKTKRSVDQSKFPLSNTLGMFAVGSHLEDVTASRGLNLQDVGSGMRAKIMATKWKMELQGNEKAGEGFQKAMFDAFPQIGTKSDEGVGLKGTGISALKEHWEKGGNVFSKQQQVQNIEQAHREAQVMAHSVFENKVGQMEKGKVPSGQWWSDNADRIKPFLPDIQSDNSGKREQAIKGLTDIGNEYLGRKMDRHGIRRG